MATKRHSAEQIVRKLREAEVELAKGATVKDACRKLAITEHTYYRQRWESTRLRALLLCLLGVLYRPGNVRGEHPSLSR